MEFLHVSCEKEVIGLYKWLYDRWVTTFCHFTFMDIELKGLVCPCSLEDFRQKQLDRSELVAKQLKSEIRRAFCDQFTDHLQDIFDFFQANINMYRQNSLYKIFKAFDIRLEAFLRTMLTTALDSWAEYVNKSCSPVGKKVIN